MASPVVAVMYAAEPAALAERYTADMVAAVVDEDLLDNHLYRLAQEVDMIFAYRGPEVRDLAPAEHKNAERVFTYLNTEEQDR